MLNAGQKIKEYFNINGYYLKLNATNQCLSLISYNSNVLDGIKYESRFNLEEIKKNELTKNLTIVDLFNLISKKINENKILIKASQENITFILLENISYESPKDIKLILNRNNREYLTEYESVLSNVILNLKEENKNIKNEINEIKNLLKLGNNSNNLQSNNVQNHAQVKKLSNNSIKPSINNLAQSTNIILNNKISNQIPNKCQTSFIGEIPSTFKSELSVGPINEQDNNQPKNGINQTQLRAIMNNNKMNLLKNISNLNIESLSKIQYPNYPKVEISSNSFGKIVAYAYNSYHGIVKNNNEDKITIIPEYKPNKLFKSINGNIINYQISYFGIYDGHGGDKCSNFLKEKMHLLLFNSNHFPAFTYQAIYESFAKSEQEFMSKNFDPQKKLMLDKSGSCVVSILLINDICFANYLGDSRALYSFDSGNQLFQITRDHKPNDPTEKSRIEKAGGSIYKDTRLKINGQYVHVDEKAFPDVIFPYRVIPGNLSVSFK